MKNRIKLFGIIALVAVIGLAFIACDDPEAGEDKFIVKETSGRLTITGIPAEYNGKWIAGKGDDLFVGSGFQNGSNVYEWKLKGVQIASGSVTLKVWKYREESQGNSGNNANFIMDNYIGSDSNAEVYFPIRDTEIADFRSGSDNANGYVEVTFTNGIGSGVFVPIP
jgi:hypothetical protein